MVPRDLLIGRWHVGACGLKGLRPLLSHDAEIVFGVLIVVIGLYAVTAPCRVLRHSGGALIVATCVSSHVTLMTGRPVARRPVVGRARALRS